MLIGFVRYSSVVICIGISFQLKQAAELKTELDSGAVAEKEYFVRLQTLVVPKVIRCFAPSFFYVYFLKTSH
jgi:hypothetical protein